MIKSLGALLGGIFIGAVAMEIIHRKYPEALGKLRAKAGDIASGAREAFKKGYEGAARFPEVVEPSV